VRDADGGIRDWRIAKPLVDVSAADVEALEAHP